MLDEMSDVRFIDGVEDVPEVFSASCAAFRQVGWEVRHELLVVLHQVSDLVHRQFIELRNNNRTQIFQRHQPLLAGEDLLEEVAVEHLFWRNVELQRFLEVLHEANKMGSKLVERLTRSST